MTTLLDLKKQCGLTNKQIGQRINRSATTVGNILHGTHTRTYTDEDIERLADILGVTFERCWYAMCESTNEYYNRPGEVYERHSEGLYRAELELREEWPDRQWNYEPHPPRALATVDATILLDEEKGPGKR